MWHHPQPMETFVKVLKWIGGLILAILAPVILIVIGAMMFGYGVYKEWEWMRYGGMFLIVLGIVWITKYWWDD